MVNHKVLLISITPREHRNITILTLFTVLRSQGIDTEVLFLMNEAEYDRRLFSQYLADRKFAVIGLSVTTDGFYFAGRLTADIASASGESAVIWGGVHPTICPEESIGKADNICVGDGDVSLPAFVRRVFSGENRGNIPGIWTKGADGAVLRPADNQAVSDFNSLPVNRYDWPRFYLIDGAGFRQFSVADYVKYSQFGDGYTILTSRFCPYACTFCSTTFFRKFHRQNLHLMRRSVDHVIQELLIAKAEISVVKFVNFPDDHFLSSREWTREFCEKYSRTIGLPFSIRSTPEQLDENVMSELKKAGLASVQMGIQTGSRRIQKEIYHRSFNREKILSISKLFSSYQVPVLFDIIIHSEFEDDRDRDMTIELLLELERPFRTNVFSLVPYPGTDILRIYKEKGITPELDPYQGGAIEVRADRDDWYKQMAFIAGYVPKSRYERLYRQRGLAEVREECYQLYLDNFTSIAMKEKWVVTTAAPHKDADAERL
jgi:radical SAM superfamily enzyme YgiQ (UPF0313 family)